MERKTLSQQLREHLASITPEQFREEWKAIEDMNLGGPTCEEFLYNMKRSEAIKAIAKSGGPFSIKEQNYRFMIEEGMRWQIENPSITSDQPTGSLLGAEDWKLLSTINKELGAKKNNKDVLLSFATYVGCNPGLVDDFLNIQ